MADDLDLREAIEAVALEYPRYGYRRVHAELVRRGWHVNHKRVQRLMQAANLLVEVRRYCQTKTASIPMGIIRIWSSIWRLSDLIKSGQLT